jgi:hypothetical protein
MPPCGAALFAFRQFIGRAVDIGERQLCGTPVISRYRPGADGRVRPLQSRLRVEPLGTCERAPIPHWLK